MKTFNIDGNIHKKNNNNFTEIEKNKLLDDFIDFLESKNLEFYGYTK